MLSAVHRIAGHRAWAAWIKAIRGLTWLLAVLVVTAAVDRLPDPPAARADYAQFKISSSHEQPLSFAAPGPVPVAMLHVPESGIRLAPVRVRLSRRPVVLQRATDSSPPIPQQHFSFKAI
jgi:hypothetical protein